MGITGRRVAEGRHRQAAAPAGGCFAPGLVGARRQLLARRAYCRREAGPTRRDGERGVRWGGTSDAGDRAELAQRGNERAAARNASFSAGAPIDTRTPPVASGNARTITMCCSVCAANSAARSRSGSHTKFARDSGTS